MQARLRITHLCSQETKQLMGSDFVTVSCESQLHRRLSEDKNIPWFCFWNLVLGEGVCSGIVAHRKDLNLESLRYSIPGTSKL